jgi:hypothetical protein
VIFGWIAGSLKSISYANKDLICASIGKIIYRKDENKNKQELDRIIASLSIGVIDAMTTHVPSSMRRWARTKSLILSQNKLVIK